MILAAQIIFILWTKLWNFDMENKIVISFLLWHTFSQNAHFWDCGILFQLELNQSTQFLIGLYMWDSSFWWSIFLLVATVGMIREKMWWKKWWLVCAFCANLLKKFTKKIRKGKNFLLLIKNSKKFFMSHNFMPKIFHGLCKSLSTPFLRT